MEEFLDIHMRVLHRQYVADSNRIYFLQIFSQFYFIGDSNLCYSSLYHILLQLNRFKIEYTKLPCLDIPSLSWSLFFSYFCLYFFWNIMKYSTATFHILSSSVISSSLILLVSHSLLAMLFISPLYLSFTFQSYQSSYIDICPFS